MRHRRSKQRWASSALLLCVTAASAQDLTLRLTHDATGPVEPGEAVTFTLTAEFDPQYTVLESVNIRLVPSIPGALTIGPNDDVPEFNVRSDGWAPGVAGGIGPFSFLNSLLWEAFGLSSADRSNPIVLGTFEATPACAAGEFEFILSKGSADKPIASLAQTAFQWDELSPADVVFESQPLQIAQRAPAPSLLAIAPFGFGAPADPAFDSPDARIYDATFLSNGDLVILYGEGKIEGLTTQGMARWDGTQWQAIDNSFVSKVSFIETLSNGKLIAAGSVVTGIRRLDATGWIALGPLVAGRIADVKQLSNGLLVAVGLGLGLNGELGSVAISYGAEWESLGGVIDEPVYHVEELPNGDVVIAGLGELRGDLSGNIARLQNGDWVSFGGTARVAVAEMVVDADGNLVVARRNSIRQHDGQGWTELPLEFNGPIADLAALPDGSLVAGGAFTTVNGLPSPYGVRIRDGQIESITTGLVGQNAGDAPPVVTDIAINPEGEPVLVTYIDQAHSYPVSGLLQTVPGVDACCLAIDFQPDGRIDSGDIIAFVGAFLGAKTPSDLNADGYLDFSDIQQFVRVFLDSGCAE